MKIKLLKTDDNYIKGWELIAENFDDTFILGVIRQFYFFGVPENGTEPKYNGMVPYKTYSNVVEKIKFRIPKNDPILGEDFDNYKYSDDFINDLNK